jgi:signal transduction histidine kinase
MTKTADRQAELEGLLHELERARLHAELAGHVKSNFLRMMSHELKTPITAMQLYMRMLEGELSEHPSPRVREGTQGVSRCVRRLLHLIDITLQWARIESGRCRLSVEAFDLPRLVAEVASEVQGHAVRKALELHVSAPDGPHAARAQDMYAKVNCPTAAK